TNLFVNYEDVKIFPNPVKNKFYIENGLKQLDLKISIYNLRGILVKSFLSKYNVGIDVSDINRGNYLVKCIDVISNKCIGSNIKLIVIN
ncbi:MAG: T9SS type A sorting domain-containing protein, partial [Bacteroidia bacterium]